MKYRKKSDRKAGFHNSLPPGLCWALSLICMLLTIVFMSSASRAMTDLSDAQRLQLESGDVVLSVKEDGNFNKGMVEATILIEAPAEIIWRVMIDCKEVPTFVPGINDCRVLSAGENWEIIEHDVKWTWFFPEMTYAFRAQYDKHKRIDFVRTGGDLKDMVGAWSLLATERGNKTIVCYSVYLDPGFLVPQWLVKLSLKKDLPAVLQALQKHVMSIN